MALDTDISLLSTVPLFSDISPDKLRLIAFGTERRNLQPGQMLFREGALADCAFVVAQGRFELSRTSHTDLREVLGMAGPGTLLGELAMITEVNRSITATAVDNAEVMRINRSLFKRMLEEYPEIAGIVSGRIKDNLAKLTADLGKVSKRFMG